MVIAGSPKAAPADSTDQRIDPNSTDSPFAGVGSIQVQTKATSFIGTGTVIGKRSVLTAAHVVDLNNDGKVDGRDGAQGVYFILNVGGDQTAKIAVIEFRIAPDFSGFNHPAVNDDLAVLTLAEDVPDGVPIYSLPTSELEAGTVLTLVGYGRAGDGLHGYTASATPSVKRVGENTADAFYGQDDKGQPDANEVFRFDFDGPSGNGPLGGPTLGNDKETQLGGGDSGGPAFSVGDGGQLMLVGVTSFTQGANAPRFGSMGGGAQPVRLPVLPLVGPRAVGRLDHGRLVVRVLDPGILRGGWRRREPAPHPDQELPAPAGRTAGRSAAGPDPHNRARTAAGHPTTSARAAGRDRARRAPPGRDRPPGRGPDPDYALGGRARPDSGLDAGRPAVDGTGGGGPDHPERQPASHGVVGRVIGGFGSNPHSQIGDTAGHDDHDRGPTALPAARDSGSSSAPAVEHLAGLLRAPIPGPPPPAGRASRRPPAGRGPAARPALTYSDARPPFGRGRARREGGGQPAGAASGPSARTTFSAASRSGNAGASSRRLFRSHSPTPATSAIRTSRPSRW